MIYNQRTDGKIGTIKCGEKIEIEIDQTLGVEAKALLLAAAVVIVSLVAPVQSVRATRQINLNLTFVPV